MMMMLMMNDDVVDDVNDDDDVSDDEGSCSSLDKIKIVVKDHLPVYFSMIDGYSVESLYI
jgi:hypothetical protein